MAEATHNDVSIGPIRAVAGGEDQGHDCRKAKENADGDRHDALKYLWSRDRFTGMTPRVYTSTADYGRLYIPEQDG